MKLEPGTIVAALGEEDEYSSRWEVLEPFQTTRLRQSYLARNGRPEFNNHKVLLSVCRYNDRLLGNKDYVDNVRRRLLHEAEMLTVAHNALPEPVDLFVVENADDTFQFAGSDRYRVTEPVLVTEALAGKPLDVLLAPGALSERRALILARKIADFLTEMHHKGILAYELRPEDIVIDPDDHDRIWIGSCANYQTVGPSGLVQPGELVVPLSDFAFTAPEVEDGRVALDRRADLWSFGALLLHLLTAKKVADGVGPSGLVTLPQLSEETCRLLGRCLATAPKDWFADVEELIAALDHTSGGLSFTAPPAVTEVSGSLEDGTLTVRWELPLDWTDTHGLVLLRWRSSGRPPPDLGMWKVMFDELPSRRQIRQETGATPGETHHYAVLSQAAFGEHRKRSHPGLCAVPIADTWRTIVLRALSSATSRWAR